MFDIGWTELLLVGIVALIVVGPKDLPGMFRALGQFTGKIRGMAREFQRAMNEAAEESGMGDIQKDLKNLNSARNLGLDKVQDAVRDATKWTPETPAKAMGPETAKLAQERAETARKVHENMAKKGAEKLAAEKAAAASETAVKAAPQKTAAKASAAKAPAKKAVAKKAAAKTPTAKKPAAKKPAPKAAAKTPAAKTAAPRKPAAKKPAAKKASKA